MKRICLVLLSLLAAQLEAAPEKGFSLIFHNHHTVPSNLYANFGTGGGTTVRDNPEGDGKIYNLIIYPSDEESKAVKLASAVISNSPVEGILRFRQSAPPVGPTHITGFISGLTPGSHEIRIHRLGDMENGCLGGGNVFDPYTIFAEWRWRLDRSVGDVGSITADENGNAKVDIIDKHVKLVGPRSVIGRMVSIVELQNELLDGNGAEQAVGCAVIGFA